jgi:hypothetical protein
VGEDGEGEGDEGGLGGGEPGPGIAVGGVATVTAGVGGGAGVGGTGAGGTGAGAGGVVGTGRETVGTVTVTPGIPTSPSAWAESAPASTPATASAAATTAVLTFLAMAPLVEEMRRGTRSCGDALMWPAGRIAQRESARFTRERSLVRSQVRPLNVAARPYPAAAAAQNGDARRTSV